MAAEDLIGTESFTKRDVTPGLDPGPILRSQDGSRIKSGMTP